MNSDEKGVAYCLIQEVILCINNNIKMQQNLQEINKRMRTEVKYSALVTLSMRLLKKHKLYQRCCLIAIQEKIKSQKNLSVIALRLSVVYDQLIKNPNMSRKQVSLYIFSYLSNNLNDILHEKYMKEEHQNTDLFIQVATSLNQKYINVFKQLFLSNPQTKDDIKMSIEKLYEKNERGKFQREQLKSMQKLASIFLKFAFKEPQNLLSSNKNDQNESTGLQEYKKNESAQKINLQLAEQNQMNQLLEVQSLLYDNQSIQEEHSPQIPYDLKNLMDQLFINQNEHNSRKLFIELLDEY